MVIPGLHDTVHQASLIGKEKESLGFLVQTADGIYPHRIVKIFGYCHLITLLPGAADDPPRLVKKEKDFFLLYGYRSSVNTDLILPGYLHSGLDSLTIHGDPPLLRQSVRLSSGAGSGIT